MTTIQRPALIPRTTLAVAFAIVASAAVLLAVAFALAATADGTTRSGGVVAGARGAAVHPAGGRLHTQLRMHASTGDDLGAGR